MQMRLQHIIYYLITFGYLDVVFVNAANEIYEADISCSEFNYNMWPLTEYRIHSALNCRNPNTTRKLIRYNMRWRYLLITCGIGFWTVLHLTWAIFLCLWEIKFFRTIYVELLCSKSVLQLHLLTLYSAEAVIVPHRTIWSWYTGRWWVGCYIRYSEEPGWATALSSPLLTVPNVTAHPSTASVPITMLLYNGPLLCSCNVPIKG